MRPPRFRLRTLMLAVAAVAVLFAAWDHARETYEAYRFQKGWETLHIAGEVVAIDQRGGRVTISLGSDDGIAPGDMLYLFREEPEARYLCKVRIISAEYDSAVGQVVSGPHGPSIREGDGVAHFTWVKLRWPYACGDAISESMHPPE